MIILRWKGMGLSFLFLFILLFDAWPASGQAYPTRAIKLIVPFVAGGVNTVVWRSMADPMSKVLGQPVVIENKPGAAGTLAYTLMAKAEPDGYTTGSAPVNGITNTFLAYEVSYDPFKSFTYIGEIWAYNEVLAVRSDSPWKTWAEFMGYVKQHPEEVKVGYSNPIGSAVVSMKFVAKKNEMKLKEVVFVGEAELVPALLGGHIDAFIGAGVVHTLIKDGRARGLLAITVEPIPGHPDIPNVYDLYGINAFNICGLAGPARMPEPIVRKLENALAEGIKSPLYLNTIEKMGAVVRWRNSREFTQDVKTIFDTQRYIMGEIGMLRKK